MGSKRDVLHGRVAVVTGATRGLGLAMARLLGQQGATVVLAARSDDDAAAAVERLLGEGIAVSGRYCDTGILADVEALCDDARSRGMLDIWVNNAGASGVFGPTASTPVDDFTRVVPGAGGASERLCVQQALVRQFTETLRLETRGTGVRVHGMNPGLVTTDLLGKVTSQPGYEQRLGGLQVVVGLWGQTPDVAARPLLRRGNRMPLEVTLLE